MKKRFVKNKIAYVIAVLLIFLSGCSDKIDTDKFGSEPITNVRNGELLIYALDESRTHIEPIDYTMKADADSEGVSECVKELLTVLISGPFDRKHNSVFPSEITSVLYKLDKDTSVVNIDFEKNYYDISQTQRILCQAAVTRTLCQLDGIEGISFSSDKIPVVDSKGEYIGVLTPESFVENNGAEINTYERAELRLYFADEGGEHLVETTESVIYSSNISMDKLIIDHLISGPKSYGAFPTLSSDVVINQIITQDGICYVNLNKELLNRTTNVTDEVCIFSIVNSLTELTNVNKVQIMVDGNTNMKVGDYDLSGFYERNLELLK